MWRDLGKRGSIWVGKYAGKGFLVTAGHAAASHGKQHWRAGIYDRARDRVLLLKPRVMSLVVFTGGVGYAVAPGTFDLSTFLMTMLCMAAGAGACGALNMWYDADIDAIMQRTLSRPIPRGTVRPTEALVEGSILAVLSVVTLGVYVNWPAAYLLALTIGFYVFVYTMGLKRRTAQNIVIGGASGALPPMIGWAAQTGTIDLASVSMFLIIFLWTPPHFWALAMGRATDYAKAGIPMLPVVAGPEATCRQIIVYTALLIPSTYLPLVFGFEGWIYFAAATALNAVLAQRVYVLCTSSEPEVRTRAAYRLFGYSIFYLFALFVVLLSGAF